jgi:hypothetical protein
MVIFSDLNGYVLWFECVLQDSCDDVIWKWTFGKYLWLDEVIGVGSNMVLIAL